MGRIVVHSATNLLSRELQKQWSTKPPKHDDVKHGCLPLGSKSHLAVSFDLLHLAW